MGQPLLHEVVEKPATSGVVLTLAGVWFGLNQRQLGYAEVGLSYDRAFCHRETWRVATAQLSHVDLLHLIFNCSSLWTLGYLEKSGWGRGQQGSSQYLGTSLLLLLLSGAITLAVYHGLIVYLRKEQFAHVTMVGYSAVVFGLMTLSAMNLGGSFNIAGVLDLPTSLAPFLSLVVTSLVVRRASFVGHLSGIISGALISIGLFDWLNLWWSLSLLGWAAALLLWQLVQSGHMHLPLVVVDESSAMESGSAGLRIPHISGLQTRT